MFSTIDLTAASSIEANRRSEMTPAQRSALAGEAGIPWLNMVTPLLILPAMSTGIIVVVWLVDSRRELPLWVYGILVAFLSVIWLLAVAPMVRRVATMFRVRGDLAAGRVEMIEGQCSWRRNKYVLETPAQRLRLLPGARGLGPGSYRFYFLPGSGVALSAERLTPPGGEDPRAELLTVMAQVNGFALDALDDNRQGRLAGSQLLRLFWRLGVQGLTLALAVAATLAVAWLIYANIASNDAILVLAGAAAVVLVIGLIALWVMGRLVLDIARGRVTAAQGAVSRTVTTSYTQHGSSTSYFYQLNKQKFAVSGAAYQAFIDGQPYRLYYLPLSRTLVAIEPI